MAVPTPAGGPDGSMRVLGGSGAAPLGPYAQPWERRDSWGAGRRHRGDWQGDPGWRIPAVVRMWVPVGISAIVMLPPTLWGFFWAGRPLAGIAALIAIAGILLLLLSRRLPGTVAIAESVLIAAFPLVTMGWFPPFLPYWFAIIRAFARGRRVHAWIGIGVAVVLTSTVLYAFTARVISFGMVVPITIASLTAVGIGSFLRGRHDAAALWRQRAEQRRDAAAQAERVRIARELHDVLAHSLSSISVQAGVGLHLMDRRPEQAREALENIRDTSKTALDEVRAVLGVLRSGDADAPLVPEPGLDRLDALSGAFASDVFAVQVDDRTDHSAVPAAVQSAVYRIAQEAVTNSARHALDATRARLVLTMESDGGADRVRLRVDDDGRGSRPSDGDGGRGLLGMRERAELLGGTLRAEREAEGFVVEAVLPIERPIPDDAAEHADERGAHPDDARGAHPAAERDER